MTAYEEWRTTGTWDDKPFHVIHDTEDGARNYAAALGAIGTWNDGPHFLRRTVTITITEWEQVEP